MNTGTNYADLFFSNVSNDLDTLENNVKEYPFSSLARFLLLYHYKKNNNIGFDNFVTQTGIYINNPFWIQYQLSKINEGSFSNEDPFQSEIQNKNVEENIPVAAEVSELPADQQIMQIPVSENDVFNENKGKNNSFKEENHNENLEENIPVAAEELIMQILVSENEVINENERKNNSFEEQKHSENSEENIPVAAEEQVIQIPVSQNEVINENEEKNNSFEEGKNSKNIEEKFLVSTEEQIMQIPVTEVISKDEKETSKDYEYETKIPENNDNEPIAYEPLHTVDYFASQGIKISEEALENDHLGQQVKSFTAWLKSMKKLHPGQLPEQNEVIEKIIQANAEVSNQNANVLTEAMAEVLIKQNKKEKAMEMYQKLSLINPSKSAYFAAKIESLKII